MKAVLWGVLTIDQREKIRLLMNHGISGLTERFFLTYYDDFISVYTASLAIDELDKIVSGH
jgi:hypothetical protein